MSGFQNRVKRAVILCEGRAIGTADLDLARRADEPLNLRRILAEAEQRHSSRPRPGPGQHLAGGQLLGVSRPLTDLLRPHGRHDEPTGDATAEGRRTYGPAPHAARSATTMQAFAVRYLWG